MKYSNLRAFEKHLQEASPDHFSPVYFLIGKEEFERKEAEALLLDSLLGKNGPRDHNLTVFNADNGKIEDMLAELGSLSFFADRRAVCIRNGDKLNKEATGKLEAYFNSPARSLFLIISASAINRGTKFYKNGEKAGVVLDLQEEKPWEKENSLTQKVVVWAREAGKTLSPDTARFFIRHSGSDQAILRSELDKLLCYTADKDAITAKEICEICTGVNTNTAWQLGDAVFHREGAAALKTTASLLLEGTPFFSLVRQLRSQFQSKLQICDILSEGGGAADIQRKFPYMKGQILQQNIQLAKNYGMSSLKKGILAIDASELAAKNSSTDIELLAQQLICKLIIN